MSAEPEAIRAFEHAGWQRAAAVYTDSFAHATAPIIKPLLEVPNSLLASLSLTLRVGLAISRRLSRRAVRPRMDWASLQRWSALHGKHILKSS